jgi:hypothetical protein
MGGLGRRARSADRLEAEPLDFHERVREGFLSLARAEPERYLVLDATRPANQISREIQDRIREMLPDPVPPVAEANTGSFPAIVDDGVRPADGMSPADGMHPADGMRPGNGVRSGSASRDWFGD